jgi:hypothetical protein
MDQVNEQLLITLTRQYSKLSFTSQNVLTGRLKDIEWWNKEQYRLKVQRTVSLIGFWIVILGFCIVIGITILKNFNNEGSLNVPLLSYALSFSSILISQWVLSATEERNRLFESLQLLMGKNRNAQ